MRSPFQFVLMLVLVFAMMAPLAHAQDNATEADETSTDGVNDGTASTTDGHDDTHKDGDSHTDQNHDDPYAKDPYADEGYHDDYHDDHPGDGYGDHGAGHDPYAGEDPCADLWDRMEGEMDALHARHEEEWRQMDAEWDAFYAEGNHTPEEEQAFQDAQHQREQEMQARHDAEFRALEQRHQDECENRHQQKERDHFEAERAQHPDDPCGDIWASKMDRMEALDQRHREQWRALEAEWDEFYSSGKHTPEEEQAFEARMHEREQALDAQQEQERRALEREAMAECRERERDQMQDERERHFEEERQRRAAEYRHAPPEMQANMREMEELRRECEDEAFARMQAFEDEMFAKRQAFEESGNHDWESFERQMEAEHRAFENDMHELRKQCEDKMRAYWEEHVGEEIHDGEDYERMGSWTMQDADGEIFLTGKYMSLLGDPNTNTIGDIAVAGQVYIEHIDSTGYLEDFEMDEDHGGSTLTASGEGLRMRLHDNPAGVINFKSEGQAWQLTLPATFEAEQTPSGWTWSNNGHKASLRAEGASYDEGTHTLTFSGQATFLLPGAADNHVLEKVANKHRNEILDAVEDKQLGAEITIAGDQESGAFDDTVVYDDVEVEVKTSEDESEPVAVTVSADSSEDGKTFVLNLDQDLYDVGQRLDVTYFDIDEETGAETPAEIRKASSITDILDANDDDTAEYWIVLDEDGYQVLVSVPHWSTHRFKVAASDEVDSEDGPLHVVPGPGLALVALAAVGAAAAIRRRAGDE